MTPQENAIAATKLRERADCFARDAVTLRADGLTEDAPAFEIIARELRQVATSLDGRVA